MMPSTPDQVPSQPAEPELGGRGAHRAPPQLAEAAGVPLHEPGGEATLSAALPTTVPPPRRPRPERRLRRPPPPWLR